MAKNPHKASVEAALLEQRQRIQNRLDALQRETGELGTSVRDQVLGSPWLSMGLALGAGLLVGLAFGGSKQRSTGVSASLGMLSDEVLDAIQQAAERGRDPSQAVQNVLLAERARAPVVAPVAPKSKGVTRLLFGMALRFGLQVALSKWKARQEGAEAAAAAADEGAALETTTLPGTP